MTEELRTEVLLKEKRIFKPSKDVFENSNIAKIGGWEKALKDGEENMRAFWEREAKELDWFKKWDKVLDDSEKPFYKWFTGAKCNIVYNALDRHINTPIKNKVAIIAESEKGETRKYTYYDLYREVNKFANVLKALGVKKGDRVAIYMPNIPEIAIAMMGTTKIGAIHSVVYAGFSEGALRDRINDAEAKVLV
ncbi:MAG: acetyl-coenzyme A synthetase, partial [Candidatus Altiarchaeales archaeon]